MNSSTDFESIFVNRNIFYYVPNQNFLIQCRVTRWRCNHFSKNALRYPNFCNRKYSSMHYTKGINFSSPKPPSTLLLRHYELDRFSGDTKFKTLMLCMLQFFPLQKLGVTQGLFIVKVLSKFDFSHLLEK